MPDTIVRVVDDETVVIVSGSELLTPLILQAQDQVALAEAQVALAAAHEAGAEAAQDGAEAARDSIVTTLGAVTEVAAIEASGVNLSVDYSGSADGTLGDAVGTPPLVAAASNLTVTGGLAVAPVGTSNTAPVVLRHDAGYASAIGRVQVVPLAGATQNQLAQIGALFAYSTPTFFFYWGYISNTKTIVAYRLNGTSLASQQTYSIPSAPTSPASWTFEHKYLGNDVYQLTLRFPTGESFTVSYTKPVSGAAAMPAWGMATTQPGTRVRSVTVDTNRSAVVRRVGDLEALRVTDAFKAEQRVARPVPSERITTRRERVAGVIYDTPMARSECLLWDDFAGTVGQTVGTGGDYVPAYRGPAIAAASYRTVGSLTWKINATGLTVGTLGADPSPLNRSALLVDIPQNWYRQMKGMQVRIIADVAGNSGVQIGAAVLLPSGAFAGEGQYLQFAEYNTAQTNAEARPFVDGNPARPVTTVSSSTPTVTRVEIILRVYEDMVYGTVNGEPFAKRQDVPLDSNTKYIWRDVTAAGISISGNRPGAVSTTVRLLEVGPVPAAGSSRYRCAPPEAPAAVPAFTKQGVVFDGNNSPVPTKPRMLGWSVVPMYRHAAALGITPIDNYYAYFGSDHSSGIGGIWLATAPALTGPWTVYTGPLEGGRIYLDNVVGTQTEAPCAQYDEAGNRIILIYSNDTGSGLQRSYAATSTNGVAFTRQGETAQISLALRGAYVKHDGYMSFGKDPLGIVPDWIGWPRISPGTGKPDSSPSTWGISRSADGLKWYPDLLPVTPPGAQKPIHDYTEIPTLGHGAVPFAYQGQRLFPYAVTKVLSNVDVESPAYMAIARLGDDMRSLSAEEYLVPLTDPVYELNQRVTVNTVLVEGNTVSIIYTCGRRYVHLMTANLAAPPAGQTKPF
jgi:hypothetical protein